MTGSGGGDGEGQERGSALQRVTWPLLAVVTAYLYFFAGSYFGVYDPRVRAGTVVIVAAVLAAWGIAALRDARWRPDARLWPAFAVSLAVMTVAMLASRNPRIGLDYVAYSVILTALYLLLRQLLAHHFFRPRITALAMLLGMVMLLAYLLAITARWITWWGWVGRLAAPPLRPFSEGLSFGNPGPIAALAVLGLIVTAAHLGFGSRARVAAIAVQSVVAGFVVFTTASRASWVAIAGTVGVFAVVGLLRPGVRAWVRSRLRTRHGRAVAVALVVAAAAAAVPLGPRVVDRFLTGGVEARTDFIAAALRMFQQSPVLGVGPGMWVADRIAFTTATETDYYIPYAHNLPAQIAAEYGVVGIAASVFVLWVLWRLFSRAVRGGDPVRRRWAWAAAVALVYIAIQQEFDLFANMPTILFVLALPVAVVDAMDHEGPLLGLRLPARRALTAAGTVALVAAVAWSGWAEQSALAQDRALNMISDGNWAGALPDLEQAHALDRAMPAIELPLGLAQARTDPAAALKTLRGLAQSDDLPTAWLDVAALEQAAGDAAGARQDLGRALRLGQQQPQVAFAAGWLYEQLGDAGQADTWYSNALVLETRLAGDPFWADPARAGRWPQIRDAALARLDPFGRADLWLSADDVVQARAALATVPAADQGSLPDVLAAWDGDAAARSALYAYTSAHPLDITAITYSARVAARAKDYQRSQMYRDWADTVGGNTGALGAEVAVGEPQSPGRPVAGLNSIAWGIYTYRRPTPSDQLVPSLPHLVLTE